MNKLKKFFEPTIQNPSFAIKSFISYIVSGLFGVVNVFFVQKILFLIENDLEKDILKFAIYFASFNIGYFIFATITRRWAWADLFYAHIKSLHRIYMDKFNSLDNTSVEKLGTGKCISIISKGIDIWTNFLVDLIEIVAKLGVTLIATFLILKSLGSIYIIIFFSIILFIHVYVFYLNNKAMKHREGITENRINYDKQIVKMIMSKFEILQNDKNKKEIGVLDNYIDIISGYNIKLNNYLFLMFITPNFVYFLTIFASLFLVIKLDIPFSIAVSLFMMLAILKEILLNSIFFFKNLTKNFYSIEKLWDLVDNTPVIEGLESGENFLYKTGDIVIKNLDFQYGETSVFKDFSIEIKGGTKTAFVGASGGGKTTLIKLICGFLKQNSGNIILDGQDLSNINLKSYYKHIGYLTQEPSVFDGSIYDNLVYGIVENKNDNRNDNNRSLQEKNVGNEYFHSDIIKEAIKKAGCEFIYDFKDGLNTEIGERGVRLSGGQKQRLAIAKLFIKNPEIIILDEPTSALDSFSEDNITTSFDELFKGRTVLIIAHRLQTVKNADEIIVLDGGQVKERGSHEELIKNDGYYKKMLDLQSGF